MKTGDNVFVETVSKHWVGELVSEGPNYVVLVRASWVADSGQYYSTFLATGKANGMEIEPCPPDVEVKVLLGPGSTIQRWKHALFTKRV